MDEIEGPFEPPLIDERGGVTWRVRVGGKVFDVLIFLDSAYGPEAPLFRVPEAETLMDAAHAVNAVFTHWQANRPTVDPVLSRASAHSTKATRHLIPLAGDPDVRLEATIIQEETHTVAIAGPPEITHLESVRFPLLVDGAPVVHHRPSS